MLMCHWPRWSWRQCRWASRWRGCLTWPGWKDWCVTLICNLQLARMMVERALSRGSGTLTAAGGLCLHVLR
ncbi:hypothetical protein EMIT047CA2_210037 [Pseudomonas soli]